MRQMRLAKNGAVVSFDSRKTRCCIVIPVGPGALPVLSFLALFSSWVATTISLAWGASFFCSEKDREFRPEVVGGQ